MLHKIVTSIQKRNGNYRILTCTVSSAQDGPEEEPTLFDAYQKVVLERLFEDSDTIPFASIQGKEIQEMLCGYELGDDEIKVEGAYIDVEQSNKCLDDPPPSKKTKKMKNNKKSAATRSCSSEFCCSSTTSSNISRFFLVGGKTYCGRCLDEFYFLKLRFCFEHVDRKGGSGPRIFSIEEDSYGDGAWMKDFYKLKADEFWIRLFLEENGSDCGEIRFVGKGARSPCSHSTK